MKSPKIFIAVLLSAGILASCSADADQANQSTQSDSTATLSSDLVRVVNVSTMSIKTEPFNDYLNVVGTVRASEDINLASEVSGRILEMLVRRGSSVAKGAPVAKIDDAILKLEVQRAKAQAENARENYDRRKQVWDQDKIGSELDLISAKTDWEQADAALKLLQLQLDRTIIRAPFNAKVEDILSEVGETVAPGTPVVRLISSGSVRVRAGIPARFTESVDVGDNVEISFEDHNNETVNARIVFVGNSIDPQARTFDVEASIENRGNKYKIDMVANMKIRTRSLEDVIVLPQEYVFRNENGYQVYVVGTDENGNAVSLARQVTTGALFNNRVVITDGLNVGDSLITVGASGIENLTRINIINNTPQGVTAISQK